MVCAYFDSCEECCDGCCLAHPDTSSLFCSELAALVLQRAEVLSEERPADEMVPPDFLGTSANTIEQAHLIGVTLAEPRSLKLPAEEKGQQTDGGAATEAQPTDDSELSPLVSG